MKVSLCNIFLSLLLIPFCANAKLSPDDSRVIAQSKLEQDKKVSALIVARLGSGQRLADIITQMGGFIQFRADDIEYYRVSIDINKIMDVAKLPDLSAIEIARVTSKIYSNNGDDNDISASKVIGNRSSSDVFFPSNISDWFAGVPAIRGDVLRKTNPTFDGRGVTIAHIEDVIDPAMPEMQTAINLQGNQVPKVPAVYGIYPPDRNVSPSDEWTSTQLQLRPINVGKDRRVNINGRNFQFPAAGRYYFGFLRGGGQYRGPEGELVSLPKDLVVARRNECVWLDTNDNGSLRDEKCYKDYNETQSMAQSSGRFRDADNQAIGPRFFIFANEDSGFVAIATTSRHAAFCAVAMVGSRFFGKDGSESIAPGAQVIPYAIDVSNWSLVESYIAAARNDNVDIVLIEPSSEAFLETPHTVSNLVLDRLSEKYDKIFIAPAANQRHLLNSGREISGSKSVLSVGNSTNGIISQMAGMKHDAVVPFIVSSGGPAIDGSFGPDVIAPGMLVLPLPDYFPTDIFTQVLCPDLAIQAAYSCTLGTSLSAPVAAGAAAVLLSAVRQHKLEVSSRDIVDALRATARFIPGYSSHLQGRGIIDLPEAWNYLKSVAGQPSRAVLEVDAPVVTALSGLLPRPGRGVGLYEREGWSPKMSGSREIYLTRVAESDEDMDFRLELVGDYNRTFKIPEKISLSPGVRAPLSVNIAPKKSGVHSAFIRIFESKNNRYVQDILITVVAAIPLNKDNNYTYEVSDITANVAEDYLHVSVPAGAAGLQITTDAWSSAMIYTNPPAGVWHYSDRPDVTNIETVPTDVPLQQTYYRPSVGVWEIALTDRGPHPLIDVRGKKVKVRAIMPERNISARNYGGAGRVFSSGLGKEVGGLRIKETHGGLVKGHAILDRDSGPQTIEFFVPEDVIYINASVQTLEHDGTNPPIVDFTLFDCDASRCLERAGGVGSSQAGVLLPRPSTGKWALSMNVSGASRRSITLVYEVAMYMKDSNSIQSTSCEPGSGDGGLCGDRGNRLSGTRCLGKLVELINRDVAFMVLTKPSIDSDLIQPNAVIPLPLDRECVPN